MKITDLRSLLIHEIKDIYNAETQLVKALPKMAAAAGAPPLRRAFEDHLAQTQEHVERLRRVFELLEQKPAGKHCQAMEGLIQEGQEMIKEDAPSDVKDAGLIAAAQRAEHYEIAAYGCARTFAEQLGLHEVARILQSTLEEEAAADERLTELATSQINVAAVDG